MIKRVNQLNATYILVFFCSVIINFFMFYFSLYGESKGLASGNCLSKLSIDTLKLGL
jgi:hypothetical protein